MEVQVQISIILIYVIYLYLYLYLFVKFIVLGFERKWKFLIVKDSRNWYSQRRRQTQCRLEEDRSILSFYNFSQCSTGYNSDLFQVKTFPLLQCTDGNNFLEHWSVSYHVSHNSVQMCRFVAYGM